MAALTGQWRGARVGRRWSAAALAVLADEVQVDLFERGPVDAQPGNLADVGRVRPAQQGVHDGSRVARDHAYLVVGVGLDLGVRGQRWQ